MIMREVICFSLLFMFILFLEVKSVKSELQACSKGYTSYLGQKCKPCLKNTYGERCRYDCSCLDFEVCDNVEGCVNYSSTTGISLYATSSTFVQTSAGKTCGVKIDMGTLKKVCCADFEEKGKGCIDCSRGYTSNIGQKCRPCPHTTYGEKCKFDCSCSRLESCDHVNGCVEFSSTSDTPIVTSSYNRTYISTDRTSTYSVNDITRSYREENTNKQCTGCSSQGLLFREELVYSALSVLVTVCWVCLCFVFLKYKTLTKKYIVTFNQVRNLSIPQQIQPREIADRLYEIINDEDLLNDRCIQQMQMSSNYLDVIHDSNTKESCESNSFLNQDNPCQLLSINQTQNPKHNLKVESCSLKSGDSSSSSDGYHQDLTQDYLNPYQPMINISPPTERKYLTIATAHSSVDGDYKDSALARSEYELKHPRELENTDITKF